MIEHQEPTKIVIGAFVFHPAYHLRIDHGEAGRQKQQNKIVCDYKVELAGWSCTEQENLRLQRPKRVRDNV